MPVSPPIGASQRDDGSFDVMFADGSTRILPDGADVRRLARNTVTQPDPEPVKLDSLPRMGGRPQMPTGAQLDAIGNDTAAAINAPQTPSPAQVLDGAPPPQPVAAAPQIPPGAPRAFVPPASAGPPGGTSGPMPGPAMAPLPRGARMVPSSITRQTEGGIDPNSPAGQAYTGSYEGELRALGAKQEAQRSYYDQMATAADAQAAQNRADQAAAEQQAREAEAKKQALITERDRQLGAANTIVQQQSDRTVDPNRIFRGNNGNRLIAGLAVALGGLGQGLLTSAGISGARNVGLDMLNNAIDTDIQSQREEIARGNVKAQNDLKRIQDQYGVDIDEASKILKVANLDITASKAAALAAQNQSANAKAQAAVIMAGIEQEKAKTVREMTAGLIGKQTTVENIRVQMPQGPGDVELAQARRAAQLAGYESTVAKSGADIARAQYMATHGGAEPPKPEDQGKDEQELAGKLATDPAVRAKEALAGYAQSRGMVQQGNGWAEGEDKLVTGANPLAHVPYTDTSRAYADQQGRLELVTEMWGRMQSGGVISPDENKRFQEQLSDLSSRDPKVAAAALTRIDQMVSAKAQALEAGYSPETVATVKGRMAPKKAETKGLQSFRSR